MRGTFGGHYLEAAAWLGSAVAVLVNGHANSAIRASAMRHTCVLTPSLAINFIGVVPEHRGREYVDDLLAEGTAALHAAGAEYAWADTDTRNLPMAAAFGRAGYAEFAKRREYGVKLAPLGAKVW